MKDFIYSGLQFFCRKNNKESILEILNQYKTTDQINILYNNGAYFHTAISHDNPSLIKILLDYMYDTQQINIDPKDNDTDQAIRYNELQNILKECKKEYKISFKIESIIGDICYEYTDNEEDSIEMIDYKDDLEGENFSYFFHQDNNIEANLDKELAGNEQINHLEDFN